MAEKNIEMRRKNPDGSYDIYYPVTKAQNVKGINGTAITIGQGATIPVSDNDAIAIGRDSAVESYRSMAIGFGAYAGEQPYYSDNIAIGTDTVIVGTQSIAIGCGALAINGYNSVAIGTYAMTQNPNENCLGGDSGEIWLIPGDLTVFGSKNFQIDHPHPAKRDTHDLRHSVVESPNAQNLYRYTIEATQDGEIVEVELPDYFMYLNADPDVWINGDGHFGRAFGKVEDNILRVTCELAGRYKCLIIATRSDDRSYVGSEVKPKGVRWDGTTEAFEVTEIIEITEIEEVA